jgi:hypothetical protein
LEPITYFGISFQNTKISAFLFFFIWKNSAKDQKKVAKKLKKKNHKQVKWIKTRGLRDSGHPAGKRKSFTANARTPS